MTAGGTVASPGGAGWQPAAGWHPAPPGIFIPLRDRDGHDDRMVILCADWQSVPAGPHMTPGERVHNPPQVSNLLARICGHAVRAACGGAGDGPRQGYAGSREGIAAAL